MHGHSWVHNNPPFPRGRDLEHEVADRYYQLIPLAGPDPSLAASPSGPPCIPDAPIEQVARISRRIFAIKAGDAIYSWSLASGDWGLVHRFEDDQFGIRTFESGHICAYWLRPDAGCWQKFQIVKIDLSNRLGAAEVEIDCNVPSEVLSLALLSPTRVVYSVRRNRSVGHKLRLWDLAVPYNHASTLDVQFKRSACRREALYKTTEELLRDRPNVIPVNHQTFAVWQAKSPEPKRDVGPSFMYKSRFKGGNIHILQLKDGAEGQPSCHLFNATFRSTLPSVRSILQWIPGYADRSAKLAVCGANQLQWGQFEDKSSPAPDGFWGQGQLDLTTACGQTCTSLAAQYLCASRNGIQLVRIDNPAFVGQAGPRWIQMLQASGDISAACLASRSKLITAVSSGSKLQVWQTSCLGISPIEGVDATGDLPVVLNSVFERHRGECYRINNQELLIFTQRLLQHGPLPKELSGSIDLQDEHFPRAEEFSDRIMQLIGVCEWQDIVEAKHALLATMLHHFQAEMQTALYSQAMHNPKLVTAEFIQFLFVNTTQLGFMRYPYTLASVKFKKAKTSEERKIIQRMVYAALEMAIGRHFNVEKPWLATRLKKFYWKMLASAQRTGIITSTDDRMLAERLTHHAIIHDPSILTMKEQIAHLQRAVAVNRGNITRVARAVTSLKDAMVLQKKRQLVFGAAKLALTYFGGKLVEIIQSVVDFSDVMELAEVILDSSPEIVSELAAYGEEQLQEAISDKVLALLGAESPDQPIEDFAATRLRLLRLGPSPARLSGRQRPRSMPAPSSGPDDRIGTPMVGLPGLCAWYRSSGKVIAATMDDRTSCAGARVYLSVTDPGERSSSKRTDALICLKEILRLRLKDTDSVVELASRGKGRIVIATQTPEGTRAVGALLDTAGVGVKSPAPSRGGRPRHRRHKSNPRDKKSK